MESSMLKRLKSQNPNKNYPSNTGQKWTDEEESLLLEELSKGIDIEIIAQSHKRTIGGINSRRREIAYKLHVKNTSMLRRKHIPRCPYPAALAAPAQVPAVQAEAHPHVGRVVALARPFA